MRQLALFRNHKQKRVNPYPDPYLKGDTYMYVCLPIYQSIFKALFRIYLHRFFLVRLKQVSELTMLASHKGKLSGGGYVYVYVYVCLSIYHNLSI